MAAIYEAADRLVGDLMDAFPDATIVAFSPHGMGQNFSDPPALILIPELMQRYWLGEAALAVNELSTERSGTGRIGSTAASSLPNREPRRGLERLPIFRARRRRRRLQGKALDWMPAARYRSNWRRMKAFAIPAYHDARIRLNVKGRESGGLVRRADYRKTLEEVAGAPARLRRRNGKPLDIEITFTSPDDPLKTPGGKPTSSCASSGPSSGFTIHASARSARCRIGEPAATRDATAWPM